MRYLIGEWDSHVIGFVMFISYPHHQLALWHYLAHHRHAGMYLRHYRALVAQLGWWVEHPLAASKVLRPGP